MEGSPLEKLAGSKQLMAFLHKGFWYCMDTPRDKDNLNEIWRKKNVPWKKNGKLICLSKVVCLY